MSNRAGDVAHFYAAVMKANGRVTDRELKIVEEITEAERGYEKKPEWTKFSRLRLYEGSLKTLLTSIDFKSLTSRDHVKLGIECLENEGHVNDNDIDTLYNNCEKIAHADRANKEEKEILGSILEELQKFKKKGHEETAVRRALEKSKAALDSNDQDEENDEENDEGDDEDKDNEKAGCGSCLFWIIAFLIVAIWRWEDVLTFIEFISN
jgi:hypothetical protein